MAGERIAKALARIDAAAGRIEAAARRPVAGADDSGLVLRYETLRRETGAALADLDRLLAELDR